MKIFNLTIRIPVNSNRFKQSYIHPPNNAKYFTPKWHTYFLSTMNIQNIQPSFPFTAFMK